MGDKGQCVLSSRLEILNSVRKHSRRTRRGDPDGGVNGTCYLNASLNRALFDCRVRRRHRGTLTPAALDSGVVSGAKIYGAE